MCTNGGGLAKNSVKFHPPCVKQQVKKHFYSLANCNAAISQIFVTVLKVCFHGACFPSIFVSHFSTFEYWWSAIGSCNFTNFTFVLKNSMFKSTMRKFFWCFCIASHFWPGMGPIDIIYCKKNPGATLWYFSSLI